MNKEYEVPRSEEIIMKVEDILQTPSMYVPDIPGGEDPEPEEEDPNK